MFVVLSVFTLQARGHAGQKASRPVSLVNAKCIRVRVVSPPRAGERIYARYAITQVYFGQQKLLGSEFDSEPRIGTLSGVIIESVPKFGENMICLVYIKEGKGEFLRGPILGFRGLYQDANKSRYLVGKSVAEAVASVYTKTQEEKRAAKLLSYAKGKVPTVSWWAVERLLSEFPGMKGSLFSGGKINPDLSLIAKLGVESFLSQRSQPDKKWMASAQRYKLLMQLVASGSTKIECDYISGYFMHIRYTGHFSLVKVLIKAINNKHFSENQRKVFFFALSKNTEAVNDPKIISVLFAYLDKADDYTVYNILQEMRKCLKKIAKLDPGLVARLKLTRIRRKSASFSKVIDSILNPEPEKEPTPRAPQKGILLVEAKCLSVERNAKKGYSPKEAKMQVTRVFYGQEGLMGQKLKVRIRERSIFGNITSDMKPGDEGLWVLMQNKQQTEAESRGNLFEMRWPVRKGKQARFAEAKELAETAGSFYTKVPGPQRISKLKEYVFNKLPEISRWSAGALMKTGGKAREFVFPDSLVKSDLSLAAKLKIDLITAGEKFNKWPSSSERKKMFSQMAESKLTAFETQELSKHISELIYRKDSLVDAAFVKTIEKLMQQKTCTRDVFNKYINAIGYIFEKVGDPNSEKVLLGLIGSDNEDTAKVALLQILSFLRQTRKLTPSLTASLKEILKKQQKKKSYSGSMIKAILEKYAENKEKKPSPP